ncbi:uncharacterized protein NEPG_00598 [Nematocida parisii ERTm1]|uniref:Uncharacterized protein n=1 Tax=Nematocida parisii (strain ERTm3) TaxID=935791 RepID=I3EDD1_NEMP3|nr:uncharacterized protein NEPG_00598 [Nematocida parisii ERTm1]EIJ87228.1 hypothetical protein NEQG_02563 [Nematocida parisii ERTm3]EIJ95073.1 hypothetical protein NEPG_00598 [Nematocida parisii ERTm1]|eukprot:XP_013058429.1 hypothetical protein NEPG_00598 [Nematocida parisii ERTm1]
MSVIPTNLVCKACNSHSISTAGHARIFIYIPSCNTVHAPKCLYAIRTLLLCKTIIDQLQKLKSNIKLEIRSVLLTMVI